MATAKKKTAKRTPKRKANKTAKKRTARKRGPKPIEFDLLQIEGFGRICCSYDEMAHALGVSPSTIDSRMKSDEKFQAAYKKGLSESKQGSGEFNFRPL